MPSKITRSTGIEVPGWFGPKPGGGYEGITKRLDKTVQRAAEWLKNTFDLPVEIRFNSSRLSGGAYIKPEGTAEIGIGGLLRPGRITEKTPVKISVFICREYLRDPAGDEYRYREFSTLRQAYAYIKRSIHRGLIRGKTHA